MSKTVRFKNLKYQTLEEGFVDPEQFFNNNVEVELKKIKCRMFENKGVKWNLPKITVKEFKDLIDTILNQKGKKDQWLMILHDRYEGLLFRLEYYIEGEEKAIEFSIPKY